MFLIAAANVTCLSVTGNIRRVPDGQLGKQEHEHVWKMRLLRPHAMVVGFFQTPALWTGGVYASDAPETPNVRFGIIALTDCASIVMAHELGLFKKFGINSRNYRGEPSSGWPGAGALAGTAVPVAERALRCARFNDSV
jgi:hypothetical protein